VTGAGHIDAKRQRGAAYRRAFIEAQAAFPDDTVAAHRYAMRASGRALRMKGGAGFTGAAQGKTKSVDGKEYPASAFAHVGDANDPSTWHLPIPDAAHVRDALVTFKQTSIPDPAKKRVARRLTSAAKKFGIDARAFATEHGVKVSEAAEEYSFEELQNALQDALLQKFGSDDGGYRQYGLCETFPDYLIAQGPDGELYRISYTVGADEEDITLGEPEEVETAYVPVAEPAK
jgi:hypothetical protein